MTLLEQLKANKGTVSSALGKELANKVLEGDSEILLQEINLTRFEPDKIKSKTVRAGAAKIVEKVAGKNLNLSLLIWRNFCPLWKCLNLKQNGC